MQIVLAVVTLAGLIVAIAATNKLDLMSFCYTLPNTESSLASRSASVAYPGIKRASQSNKVEIKIYSDATNQVHNFLVPDDDKQKAKIYRFALDDPIQGSYNVELCFTTDDGQELCSHHSAPPTPIETGKTTSGGFHELTCERTYADKSTVSLTGELKPISGYASEADIRMLKKSNGTVITKNGFASNKQVKEIKNEKMAYFAVTYPAKDLREWARKNDGCKRKYIPMIITYFVDQGTKLIIARGRLSPYMPYILYPKFLGLGKKPNKDGEFTKLPEFDDPEQLSDVPIEFLVNVDDLQLGTTYTVWHVACMVRKDDTKEGITRCAEPFTEDFKYERVSS